MSDVGRLLEALEARLEVAVERGFALAFPNALEPVQVARKLITAFEANEPGRWDDAQVRVRVAPRDFERLAGERDDLERQWSAAIARLAERAGMPLRRAPSVRLEADRSIPLGAATIETAARREPERAPSLELVVQRGVPLGARVRLDRALVIGRDPSCDVVLHDPRISRRHLACDVDAAGSVAFRDLNSANGVLLNGLRSAAGILRAGDALRIGDSELEIVGGGGS